VEARRKQEPKSAEPTKLSEDTPKTKGLCSLDAEAWEERRLAGLAREREIEEHQRISRAGMLLGESGLPARHLKALDETDQSGPWAAALAKAWEHVEQGNCVLLAGSRGRGKTQIATACGVRMTEKPKPVYYTNASQLYRDCREGMHQGKETRVLNRFRNVALLIIDECHVRGETDYEDRTLTEIVNDRYGAGKPTILITNQNKADASQSLGASIVSRLHESGLTIETNWKSFRGHA
jgi:DNA replication protein DnaC